MPLIRDLNNKWDKVFENGQKKKKKLWKTAFKKYGLLNSLLVVFYLWSTMTCSAGFEDIGH